MHYRSTALLTVVGVAHKQGLECSRTPVVSRAGGGNGVTFDDSMLDSLMGSVKPSALQWRKGQMIGEGSFGKVYRGLNTATGET